MFVIIDLDELRMIAAAHKSSHIYLIHEIDFPDVRARICNAHEGRGWTEFSREDMATLYKNTSGMEEAPEYAEAIKQLRAYVLTWPDYHKSEAELLAERQELVEDGDIPADDPIQQQIRANQAMRAAQQALIEAVEARDPDPEAYLAAKAAVAAAKPVAKPTKGITQRVWAIADEIFKTNPGAAWKEIRNQVMGVCHAEGINPGTAATQYGRWKNSKGLA